MKMLRSIANPECRCTGQSTTKVKAPCLAAAKALIAPDVSSDVPEQDTQPLMDFLFVGTGVVGAGVLGVLGVVGLAGVVVLVEVFGVVETVGTAGAGVTGTGVGALTTVVLGPAIAAVTGVPTVLLLAPSVVFVVLVVPDLSTVPVTAPVTAPVTVPVATSVAAAALDGVVSLELPCIDPHAARGRAKAMDAINDR
jgi:hypothetical protein